jgi:putative transposase
MIIPNKKLIERHSGFNFPLAIILLNVYCKCRFSMSYRDIEELNGMRNLKVDHSTIHRWVLAFAPLLEQEFRKKKKPVLSSWRMDETYIKVDGKWLYLYRAVDKEGHTVDFLLQHNRDTQSAKNFFRKALRENKIPFVVNVDKSGSNKAALDELNREVVPVQSSPIIVRQNKYLNNIVEQDHRFIKKRIKPTLWFKSYQGATATIAGIELVHMIKKGQLQGGNQNTSTYDQFISLAA